MKKIFEMAKKFWKKNIIIPSLIVFSIIFVAYSSIYLSVDDGTSTIDDHFFHYKYAKLLRTKGWDAVENFNWIYFDKRISEHTRYHVSLYQIFLIPFTYFENQELGLKISDIFIASLAIGLFYFILRKMKIKHAFLLTLLLLSFNFTVFRFLSGRAFLLTLVLVYLEIFLVVKRKFLSFFWVALFHVLWHHATLFMPFLIVGVVEIVRLATQNKIFIKNFFISIFAIVLGMAFYPKFPQNIFFWMRSILNIQRGMISDVDISSIEGKELKIVDIPRYLSDSIILPFLMIIGFVVIVFCYFEFKKKQFEKINKSKNESRIGGKNTKKEKKIKRDDLSLIFYSCGFFLLICLAGSILISGRFYDFYPPGAIIVFALAVKTMIREEQFKIKNKFERYIIFGSFIFLIILSSNSFITNKEGIFKRESRSYFYAAQWIEKNSNQGDVVFLSTWNLFPRSFFANHNNYYTMGIEPRTLFEYNSDLFWKWFNFTKNYYYCEKQENCSEEKKLVYQSFLGDKNKINNFRKNQSIKIINSIKNDFKSNFVISTSDNLSSIIDESKELIEKKEEFEFSKSNRKITVFKFK